MMYPDLPKLISEIMEKKIEYNNIKYFLDFSFFNDEAKKYWSISKITKLFIDQTNCFTERTNLEKKYEEHIIFLKKNWFYLKNRGMKKYLLTAMILKMKIMVLRDCIIIQAKMENPILLTASDLALLKVCEERILQINQALKNLKYIDRTFKNTRQNFNHLMRQMKVFWKSIFSIFRKNNINQEDIKDDFSKNNTNYLNPDKFDLKKNILDQNFSIFKKCERFFHIILSSILKGIPFLEKLCFKFPTKAQENLYSNFIFHLENNTDYFLQNFKEISKNQISFKKSSSNSNYEWWQNFLQEIENIKHEKLKIEEKIENKNFEIFDSNVINNMKVTIMNSVTSKTKKTTL